MGSGSGLVGIVGRNWVGNMRVLFLCSVLVQSAFDALTFESRLPIPRFILEIVSFNAVTDDKSYFGSSSTSTLTIS